MSDHDSAIKQAGRILIADDTPANLRLLNKLLQERGYLVHAANGGEPVFRLLQTMLPDLILLDIRMPGIDGYQVCKQLKADPRTRDIPVIFISAAEDSADKIKAFAAGGVDYVVKPFQEDEVLARVETHLALRQLQVRLEKQNAHLERERNLLLQATEDIRNLMAEQQSIFEHIGTGIAFLKEREIVRCNQMFAATFGYQVDELIGASPGLLHIADDLDQRWDDGICSAVETGKTLATDMQYKRRDGTVIWGSTTLTAVDPKDSDKGVIWVVHDIDQRKRAEQRISRMALHDDLTGLSNRALLMDRIGHAIAAANRQQRRLAVAFIDLDRFKVINDTLGHAAGDTLLQEVAERLLKSVRESDTVARLGGDEFVVLLEGGLTEESVLPTVQGIAQRIVQCVGQPVALAGEEHTVTCSIGISVYPKDGADAESLLTNADEAMYRAKQAGRNNFRFYRT